MEKTGKHLKEESGGKRRLNDFLALVMFVAFGAMAVAVYAVNMRALGWQGNSSTNLSVPVKEVFVSKEPTILLYASTDTAKYLSSVGGNYEVLLKPWRNFFTQDKIRYKEITSAKKISDPSRTVLVLPSVAAIGDNERAAITAFQKQGGNILATSTLGARAGSGEWAGYEFVRDLLGVSVTGEIPPDNEQRHLNIFGDLPFGQAYQPGERIWLGKLGSNPLRLKGGRTAASITDWARSTASGNEDNSAVLYDEFGKERNHARWVMLSFPETSWEIQRNAVHGLLEDALQWLEHQPAIYKATWPFPYRAAQLIEMDTEQGFSNALRFAAMLDKVKAPSTFYLLTSEAKRYPEIVKELSQRHEIGYHGDVHNGFKGQSEAVQSQRMINMQADMKSILGSTERVTSFRVPMESYDRTTEDLMIKYKLRSHAADPNSSNSRVPLFYPEDKKNSSQSIVVLPRTEFDDINLIKTGDNNKSLISDALINSLNQTIQMGGLGFLSIHTQNFSEDNPLAKAMPTFLERLNGERQNVWVDESRKIADWWRDRQRVSYKFTKSAAKTDLDVTIEGSDPIPGASLVVANPFSNAVLRLKAVKTNMPMPQIKQIDELRTAINFSDFAPGTYSYSMTFIRD
jgi:peptidoglycan/xylan/chitin deacetylase (PgdA/CDA1 family)